jgi:SAM-dependent methyltransferase
MNTSNTSVSSEVSTSVAQHCPLCDATGTVTRLRFRQRYDQAGADPVLLTWSACPHCHGWFVDPMPSSEQIAKHWERADYADLDHAGTIGDRKIPLFSRVLDGLAQRIRPGKLLDIGCNFGRLLAMAKERGWTPFGFEPNDEAVKVCVDAGYDVHSGWELRECGFSDEQFDAITVVDVFCCSLHPFDDLVGYHRLLRPGGAMAMRLTSKHAAIRVVDKLLDGARRDTLISRLLLGQFHSATPGTVRRWLTKAGFVDVVVQGRAMACPWSEACWKSRLAYGGMDVLRAVTLGTVNLSPGILVFARKPQ